MRAFLVPVVAIVWCVVFALILNLPGNVALQGDEVTYWAAAKNIYSSFSPSETRPLLIALIHGFPLLFGITSLVLVNTWVVVLNLMLWVLSILLVYKLTLGKAKAKASILLGFALLFCVGYLAICFKFLSESVFIFMLVFCIYLVRKFIITQNHNFLSASFGVLLLSILVKPLALGLVLIFTVFFFRQVLKIVLNKYSAISVVALILIFFQMDSLRKNQGDFTISYIDSFTYYNYLGDKAECFKNGTHYRQCKGKRYEAFVKLNNSQQKKAAAKDFTNQIRHNFPNLVKAYLYNLYANAFGGSRIIDTAHSGNESIQKILFRISRIQNVLLTFIGVFISVIDVSRFRKTSIFNLLLTFIFGYILVVSGISGNQGDRFSIVFYPIVILQMAYSDLLKAQFTRLRE
ncbi:hypothetical protein [Flavobacterium silvaticum]|uniref:Uncharacterized protein n=1 Tax=Flavobacterium silvaticum TaxID=1852020 RepID=A0A972FP98_9FLAO|nr:hypothetical protein [Flavobacterium silvaticum]NMH28900.1 hypothetical protein [Flavobacterium silvaticum]